MPYDAIRCLTMPYDVSPPPYLLLELPRLLFEKRGLSSYLCTALVLLLQVLDLPVDGRRVSDRATQLWPMKQPLRAPSIQCRLTSAGTPWSGAWLCCTCAPGPDTGTASPSGARPPPGTGSEPPSSNPPACPCALCSPAASAPAGPYPYASAASPAPRGAAGEAGRRFKWRQMINTSSHKRRHTLLNTITFNPTFLFSCWISAWVTACFIWSFRAQRDENFNYRRARERKQAVIRSRNAPIEEFTSHLFVFMCQFLRVRLQGRHVLVLHQVKHLDGAGIRRTGLLILVFFLVCAVFTALRGTRWG